MVKICIIFSLPRVLCSLYDACFQMYIHCASIFFPTTICRHNPTPDVVYGWLPLPWTILPDRMGFVVDQSDVTQKHATATRQDHRRQDQQYISYPVNCRDQCLILEHIGIDTADNVANHEQDMLRASLLLNYDMSYLLIAVVEYMVPFLANSIAS